MGGQQYVKGMVSVTSTPMVSTTAQHPEGYTQDDGNPDVWWGPDVEGPGYRLAPAWTEDEGHSLLVDVGDGLTPEGAAKLAADLARWGDQVGE